MGSLCRDLFIYYLVLFCLGFFCLVLCGFFEFVIVQMHVNTLRQKTVEELQRIFVFHMMVNVFFVVLQYVTSYQAILPISFVSFVNTVCLAERFWSLQLETMVYWPVVCQFVFICSRILLVTGIVLVTIVWVRMSLDVLSTWYTCM
jgi:hypothetical protein